METLTAPACRCGDGVHLVTIVGVGQRHVSWACDVCGDRVGRLVSRHAMLAAGVDPDTLPARLSAARERAESQPRLF